MVYNLSLNIIYIRVYINDGSKFIQILVINLEFIIKAIIMPSSKKQLMMGWHDIIRNNHDLINELLYPGPYPGCRMHQS